MRIKASNPDPNCIAYSVKKLFCKIPDDLPAVATKPIVKGIHAMVKNTPARLLDHHEIGPAKNKTINKSIAEMADI